MRPTRRSGMGNLLSALALAVSFAAAAIPVSAQYPTKPIRIIVPFAAGGTTDLLSPAAADLAAGQVQFMINSPPTVLPFVKAGKVRALAVTGAKRSPGLPDLPTIRESGFPDYETYEWYGLFAPARTPKEIVARLGQEIARILKDPELRELMLVQGAELVSNSPEEFGQFVSAEMDKWGPLARRINLRVD